MADELTRFGVVYANVPRPQTLTLAEDGDSLDNDLDLSASGTYHLVLPVTLEQYTKLLSAALNGANERWSEDYIEVIWPLIKAGKMLFCQEVAECINNDAAVQNALMEYLNAGGYGSGAGTPSTPSTYTIDPELLDGGLLTSCDNDNIFAASTQLVDLMESLIRNFIGQINTLTNAAERASTAISAIPIIGTLPFDEMLLLIDQWAEEIADGFDANYTPAIRDEYRCELFCLAQNTCSLTFDQMADYFASLVGDPISLRTFVEAVNWFISGTWTGRAVVDAAFSIMVHFMGYGSRVLNIDQGWLTKAITAAGNDSDADWSILCDPCVNLQCETSVQFDSAAEYRLQGGMVYPIASGHPSSLWPNRGNPEPCIISAEFQDGGNTQEALEVEIILPGPCTISEVRFDWLFTGGPPTDTRILLVDDAGTTLQTWIASSHPSQADVWHTRAAALGASGVYAVRIGMSEFPEVGGTTFYLDNVRTFV